MSGIRTFCFAFAVAGPMTFNALPEDLQDPSVSTSTLQADFISIKDNTQ